MHLIKPSRTILIVFKTLRTKKSTRLRLRLRTVVTTYGTTTERTLQGYQVVPEYKFDYSGRKRTLYPSAAVNWYYVTFAIDVQNEN